MGVAKNLQKKCNLNSSVSTFSTSVLFRKSDDLVTHTGQHWEEKDYRLSRFEDSPKQINSQFAIDLIARVPPKEEKSRIVSCDGGVEPWVTPRFTSILINREITRAVTADYDSSRTTIITDFDVQINGKKSLYMNCIINKK